MSTDDHRSGTVGVAGRLPGREAIVDTLVALCYVVGLLTALTLLITLDLVIRL